MIDIETDKGEWTMLAHLVCDAERARDVMTRAAVCADAFTDASRREAFLMLMGEKATDEAILIFKLSRTFQELSKDVKIQGAFEALAVPGKLEYDVLTFAEAAIRREGRAAFNELYSQTEGRQMEFLLDGQRRISDEMEAKVNAVRAAFPKLGLDGAEQDAASSDATDESLLHVPGLIDEIIAYSMRVSKYPSRTLSFCGALALVAHLAGRKFVGVNDARPNLYIVALAGSGSGKEFPRSVNKCLAERVDMLASLSDNFASGPGIAGRLRRTPTLLYQVDEFHHLLASISGVSSKRDPTAELIWKTLLEVFSASNSIYLGRDKAADEGDESKKIYYPSLSLFATGIPLEFYKAMSYSALTDGGLARFLVFENTNRQSRNDAFGLSENPPPESLLSNLAALARIGARFNETGRIDSYLIKKVAHADGGREAQIRVADEADLLYRDAERENDEMAKSVWARSSELVGKLSLNYAISKYVGRYDEICIEPEAVIWAWKVVKPIQQRMLNMARMFTAPNEFEAKVGEFLSIVEAAGRKGIMRSKLSLKMKCDPKTLDLVETTLEEREQLRVENLPQTGNGRHPKLYIAVKGRKKKGGST